MKILKVESMKQPYIKEIGEGLEAMQAEVGGRIEAFYPFADDVAIICNEDGKINGMKPNRPLFDNDQRTLIDIIYGDFAVVGLTRDGFKSISPAQSEIYADEFRVPYMFFEENGRKTFLPVFGNSERDIDASPKTIVARAVSDTFPGRGTYVRFPLSDSKFCCMLRDAEMECGKWHFEEYECGSPKVCGILSQNDTFDNVNDLAFVMSCLTDEGLEKFNDVLETGCASDASELISVASNLDDFDIIAGVRNDEDLGKWFMRDSGLVDPVTADIISGCVDFGSLGRSLRERDMSGLADGMYTDKGYIYEIFDSEFMHERACAREAEK